MSRAFAILMLLAMVALLGCHQHAIHPAPTYSSVPFLLIPTQSAELRNVWVGRVGEDVRISAYYQGYDWTTRDPRKRWLKCFELQSGRLLRDERISYDPCDPPGAQRIETWEETLAVLTLAPMDTRFLNTGSIGAYGVTSLVRDSAPPVVQVKRALAYSLPTQIELQPRKSVIFFDGRSLVTFQRTGASAIIEKIDASTGTSTRIPSPSNVRASVSNGAVHICLTSTGGVAVNDGGRTLWTDSNLGSDTLIGDCAGRRGSFVIRTEAGFEIRSFSTNARLAAELIPGLKGIDACCADDICVIRCRPDSPETLERTDWEGPLYVYRAGKILWSGTGNWSPRILRSGAIPIISGMNWVLNAASGDRMEVRGEGLLVVDNNVLTLDQSWGLRVYRLPRTWW